MRKALLVLALIAASFAGGAVVNGPGLAWAQKLVAAKLGGRAVLSAGETTAPVVAIEEAEPFPEAPPAPLAAPEGDVPPVAEPAPAAAAVPAMTPPAETPAAPPAPAGDVPAPPAPKAPGPAPPKLEPTPGPAPAAAIAAPRNDPGARPAGGGAGWGDAPDTTAPAAAVVPGRPAAPPAAPAGGEAMRVDPAVTPTGPAGSPPPGTGWAEVRRRMKELGVARYRLEAEPGGPARFTCLIPLAGERAVAQQFEAEADDELAAAEAALRRVALWRAAGRR